MGLFVWFFPLKGPFSCLKDVLCVKGWVGERQKLRPVNRASYNCYVQVRIASDTEAFGVGISFPESGFSGFTGSLEINLLGIWVTSAHYSLLFFLLFVAVWGFSSYSLQKAAAISGWIFKMPLKKSWNIEKCMREEFYLVGPELS